MANAAQQMPEYVGAAYKEAVDNILFLKRQQWLATNYALLLYAAIFVVSAYYFSRTDVARNWLGVLTIATFIIHWGMLHVFQRTIEKKDWVCSRNQDHIGINRINRRVTLASWLSHSSELS
jgi:hypothetical protein